MYISILHKQIYTSTSVQINVNSPVKKWSCQFLNTCFLAPIFETSRRKVIHLIGKIAHKKAILDKFILASSSASSDSSGDCRSPIHNGSRWLIPETSLSDEGNKKKEKEEDPDKKNAQDKPSTSSAGIQPQLVLAQNQDEEEKVHQEKKQQSTVEFTEDTNSSENCKLFPTDTSPVSTSQSKKDSSSSGVTVPFLGTEAHPITASSSSSSEKEGTTGFNTPPSTKATQVISTKIEHSDETIIITSTPIRSHPPKFRRLELETTSCDLPSEIFGSPSEDTEEHNVEPSSSEMNQGINSSPSSLSSSDHEMTKPLRDMCQALTHSQNIRKRKFFAETIAGE